MKATLLLTAFTFLILSCNSGPSKEEIALKQKELELKERELSLLENEKTQVVKKDTILNFASMPSSSEPMVNDVSIEKLLGCWTVENNINYNVKFLRGGQFQMHDYNQNSGEWEWLTGTFEISGQNIALLYDDRPKQVFHFFQSKDFPDRYFIKHPKNSQYLFERASCERLDQAIRSDTTSMVPFR